MLYIGDDYEAIQKSLRARIQIRVCARSNFIQQLLEAFQHFALCPDML